MSRASWGGQQDLSGLFSSLINENFSQIKAGINEALGNANEEQAAADQKMQAKWAAGKISDEKWLDYIRSRIADSTDPQERSQWQQILLQNQDAISDAQWETRFQQDKITVGQLLAHYRKRMGSIQQNSPAYRELASRNTELLQFQRSGGVHYSDQFGGSGGGGGSRGGSSSGGSSGGGGKGARGKLQDIITKGLKGGPTDVGYLGGEVFNTRGPNVVGVEFGAPATNSRSSLFVAVQDGLTGSQNTLEAFFDFIAANPKATAYTIPGSGQVMPINARTVRAADEQYMRITQTLVNVADKKGDKSEAGYQEGLLGTFVTTTMRDHNAMFNQPNEDNIGLWTKRVFNRMNAASTPEERARIAEEASTQLDQYVQRNYPEYVIEKLRTSSKITQGTDAEKTRTREEEQAIPTTLEEQLPPAVYESHRSLAIMFDVIANPDNYTDEDIDAIYDDALIQLDIGQGAARIHLADLMGGGGEFSTLGANTLGAGDFREQSIGIRAADLIQRGLATPDDLPPNTDLYTYQWNSNSNRMEPTLAVATPSPDGTFDIVPGVMDSSGNLTPAQNAVKYMTNVHGRQTEVWTPVIDQTPASGYVYRFGDDMTIAVEGGKKVSFKKGDLVPSSALEQLGEFGVNAYAQSGMFYKATPPGIRQADVGGQTWYFDLRINTWSPVPPWNIEPDKTDPNAIFVLDPDYITNQQGQTTVNEATLQGASTYIAAPLAPGVEGYVMPFDRSMSPKAMQNWLEGEIAAGRIVPGEYKFIDGDGNAVEMTDDQMMSLYYDPAVEARADQLFQTRMNSQRDRLEFASPEDRPREFKDAGLWQQAKRDLFLARYDRENKPTFGQTPMPAQVEDPNMVRMARLEKAAMGLGISTGFLPAPPQPTRPSGPGLDDRALRTAALLAAANRAKVERQPRLEPLPVDPVKPTIKPIEKKPLPDIDPITGNKRGKKPPVNILQGVDSNLKTARQRYLDAQAQRAMGV